MPNIHIEKGEILFLRNAIIDKFCTDTKEQPVSFRKNLTGTLRHYETISDMMMQYLDEDKKIISYAQFINESPFKITLRKWINERDEERKRHFRQLKNTLTGNVLRKLIFYGAGEERLTFKDHFILACYIYVGADRSVVLSTRPATVNRNPGTTISPAGFKGKAADVTGATVHPFPKPARCILKALDENDQILDETVSFEFNGDAITLNRDNLDPSNNTITSKTQATLAFHDGQWIIENFSQYKTTYLQVIRPTGIQKGDILVFGNKRFLFDEP